MPAFWPPLRGDNAGQVERVTLTGAAASNTDAGCVYFKVTATLLEVYEDIDLTSKVCEVTAGHGSPTTFTKKTLAEVNSSGLSGSVYFKYVEADSIIRCYPLLCTDTEIEVRYNGFGNRFPKTGGLATFFDQHVQARRDFVAKMQDAIPPMPQRRGNAQGVVKGQYAGPWRVNSVGDYELVRLQNIDRYCNLWAPHYAVSIIAALPMLVMEQADQVALLTDAGEAASKAWAGITPLIDADDDLDADEEQPRFEILRG